MKKLFIVLILLFPFFNVYAAPLNDTKDDSLVTQTNSLNITNFEIIGFDINFDISKYEYTINIPDIINKLNIIVEGDNIEVEGAGAIDITGLDKVVVTIRNSEIEQNYIINLVRQDMSLAQANDNETLVSNSEYNIFVVILLILTIVLLIVTAILVILLKHKREKEIEIL